MRFRKHYKESSSHWLSPTFVEEEWADDGWNWANSQIPEGTEDHPVVLVSWYDAAPRLRKDKRLPTEAEWQLGGPWHLSLAMTIPRPTKKMRSITVKWLRLTSMTAMDI